MTNLGQLGQNIANATATALTSLLPSPSAAPENTSHSSSNAATTGLVILAVIAGMGLLLCLGNRRREPDINVSLGPDGRPVIVVPNTETARVLRQIIAGGEDGSLSDRSDRTVSQGSLDSEEIARRPVFADVVLAAMAANRAVRVQQQALVQGVNNQAANPAHHAVLVRDGSDPAAHVPRHQVLARDGSDPTAQAQGATALVRGTSAPATHTPRERTPLVVRAGSDSLSHSEQLRAAARRLAGGFSRHPAVGRAPSLRE